MLIIMADVDRDMQIRNLAALAKSSVGFKFAQRGFFHILLEK